MSTKILSIAIATYRESIRNKIMYSVFFFAAGLLGISALFGTVTMGDHLKVIKDFGLFSLSFFTVTYAVIAGASLLHKELAQKTIYNILGKAVYRYQFVIGKYFGMLLTVLVMLIIMSIALVAFTFLFEGSFDWYLLFACLMIFFQLIIVCALAIFFSSIVVTPLLSGAFTFGLFLAGRSSGYIMYYIEKEELGAGVEQLLSAVYYLLPHLDAFEITPQVVYDLPVPGSLFVWGFFYSLGYAAVLLILATFFFSRREFN